MDARIDTTRFRVEGMDCASCASKVDVAVRRLPGVEEVSVSVVAGSMTVKHVNADLNAIAKKVSSLGYRTEVVAGSGPDKAAAHGSETSCQGHDHADHDHSGHDHDDGDHAGHNHADHDHSGHEHAKPGVAAAAAVNAKPVERKWWQTPKAQLTILCAVAVGAAFAAGKLFPAVEQWAFIIAMFVGLIPIARRAWMGAINGSPFSIETLMTVAAIGAVFINAAEEAAIVVLLFLIGELLEGVATGRARASIKALADLVPRTALREVGDKVTEIPADELAVEDVVLVRPGDRIPADGIIVSGESGVDEAPVTGESVPKNKKVNDQVFAGTINQDGALRIRVTASAADNTIARIIALVEEAQETKAPIERFIDRFSKYYTPAVMVVAALIAILPPLLAGQPWDTWVYRGLAVLLIGCPCALVISTPAAVAAALSAGARLGLLMKGGAVLERLGKIDMVAFDKTGTLTEGKPKVTDIVGVAKTEREVLALAAALEVGSSHPLAKAILERAKADNIEPARAEKSGAMGGKGVVGTVNGEELFFGSPKAVAQTAELDSALLNRIAVLNDEGKTASVLLVNNVVAGIIAMRDEPRDDAQRGLAELKRLGAGTVMLTGDNQRTATAVAASLGIEPRAELLPEDKQRIVGELKSSGKIVAKVGDGINDAPALAAADIGIAMGGGTDVALETADAAVLHGRVTDVANMIALSRTTMSNIGQNITIALGLKAVFLVTTVLGITGLWPAILADTGATVLVTANAMRLLTWKGLQKG